MFKIEKISEDSVYGNLLLGLPRLINRLRKLGMQNYYLKRFAPLSEYDIVNWEHANGVLLPADIRRFYSSMDGFLFKWLLNLGSDSNDVIGQIKINQLMDVVQIPHGNTIEIFKDFKMVRPSLGIDVKLFVIDSFGDDYRVVVVFSKFKFTNNVWICSKENNFFYLTSDFTSYFRMCVAHLGIPCWQMLYTTGKPPQWISNLITLLLPTLGAFHDERERKAKEHPGSRHVLNSITTSDSETVFVNKLSTGVFKGTLNIETPKPKIVNHRKKINKAARKTTKK
ncbi:tubulin polyglutamylase complex subunit 2-like [Atheta coriaria]|uniref:tubulin polyglutamylase complex subunit 2-like n=1 Tax=Dalotia coriaria TaxID=877792 RepID=UPI0031F41B6C